MQLFLLFAAIYLCSAHEFVPTSKALDLSTFEEYTTFWNKTFSTDAEKMVRYQNFLASATRIAELSAVSPKARFGFTKFADMTQQEFKQKMTGFVAKEPLNINTEKREALEVHQMSAINWVAAGKTTPVKNQEQCGSCWAFSATETVESANLIAGRSVPALGPQEIVDCDRNDDGCNGGDPREALDWVKSQGGQDTEACYPYTAQNGACQSSRCSPALNVNNVYAVAGSEPSIYSALRSAPLSICCDAEPWQYYTGGILTAAQCGLSIDHAIQLVGYSPNSGGYWIVRNSWGADWGENGYIYLQYGQNTCGITSRVTGATA
jgi:C1A family cysteine protease